MTAFLWLALLFLLGSRIRERLIPEPALLFYPAGSADRAALNLPKAFFNWPAALLLGVLPATTLLYFITALLSRWQWYVNGSPLLAAIAVMTVLISGFLLISERTLLRALNKNKIRPWLRHRLTKFKPLHPKSFLKNNWPIIAFLLFTGLLIYVLFFRVFYTQNDAINAGRSVVSDYGPHLASIASFARGDNYAPTDYPVFSGAGMRYHFFFFFFSACLHALGLNLTTALNLASALGLLSFSALMAVLAVYFSKRKSSLFWIQPLLFFQSSLAWLAFLRETVYKSALSKIPLFNLILNNHVFIGEQTNDNWGLWNMNVYANQRHLLFGLAAALLVVMLFLPSLHEKHPLSGWGSPASGIQIAASASREKISAFWLTRSAWLPTPTQSRLLAAASLLLFCLPYWHGAVTLALLLLLLGMAIPARAKLSYLGAAALSLGATLLYSRFFAGGAQNLVSWQFHWGFLSQDKSPAGMFDYLMTLLGLAWPALIVLPFLMQGRIRKTLSFALWLPLIFALTVSLTPDLNVNHKYVLITRLLLCLPIVTALGNVFHRFHPRRFPLRALLTRGLALGLGVLLVLSGIFDQIAYFNQNKEPFRIEIRSDFVQWLEKETDERAIFLTPTWFFHSFYYSGRQTWYGWPYYAWSAGYDSLQREKEYYELWSGCAGDFARFVELINLYRLQYAIIDEDLRLNQPDLNEDFFIEHFPMARQFQGTDKFTIYDLRPYLEP